MELEARNQPDAVELWREVKARVEQLMQPSADNAKH
jgi:hypothetical protein